MTLRILIGAEGGATRTSYVICTPDGEKISAFSSGPSNAWVLGFPEAATAIVRALVTTLKTTACSRMVDTFEVALLALSLSGMDFAPDQARLTEAIVKECASGDLSADWQRLVPRGLDPAGVVICTDVVGSAFTASPGGALVAIAGTGSAVMSVHRGPKGGDGVSGDTPLPEATTTTTAPGGGNAVGALVTSRVGGWGHAIGDEGSAYWISKRCVEEVFRLVDGRRPSPSLGIEAETVDTAVAWSLIKAHFGVTERQGMLEHLYGSFDKARFAGLAEKVCGAAREGDPLCLAIVVSAGRELGEMVASLPTVRSASNNANSNDNNTDNNNDNNNNDSNASNDNNDKSDGSGRVTVCAVGSVWKSRDLFLGAFAEALAPRPVTVLMITGSSAWGALVYGAASRGMDFRVDHSALVEKVFESPAEA